MPTSKWLPNITAVALVSAAITAAVAVREGSAPDAAASERLAWISSHLALWRIGWGVVSAAILCLGVFLAWWARETCRAAEARRLTIIAATAVALDCAGIALLMFWVPRGSDAAFRWANLLTAGAATFLYCSLGVRLTIRTPTLSRTTLVAAGVAWASGFGLSLATVLEMPLGIYVSAGLNWLSLPVLCVLLGKHFRDHAGSAAV